MVIEFGKLLYRYYDWHCSNWRQLFFKNIVESWFIYWYLKLELGRPEGRHNVVKDPVALKFLEHNQSTVAFGELNMLLDEVWSLFTWEARISVFRTWKLRNLPDKRVSAIIKKIGNTANWKCIAEQKKGAFFFFFFWKNP